MACSPAMTGFSKGARRYSGCVAKECVSRLPVPLLCQDWRSRARDKAADVRKQIRLEWLLHESVVTEAKHRRNITGRFITELLTSEEVEITSYNAVQIVQKIRERELTAVQVTLAFCRRAAVAEQLNNCLHEIFFEDALARAVELDEFQTKNNALTGPLHGLPISLKDQFHVKNVETTMGYVGWIGTYEGRTDIDRAKKAESQIVKELLSLGAILYCKTSLPQTLLLGETHNNIFGHTMNPVQQQLSCGGSSGGEGALQALGGSCLGLGTDIGGSVRIPAAFCGIYSIKPSAGRFSYRNVANSNPGQTIVQSTIGFMATALPALELIMAAILSTQPWLNDPDVEPIPWRDGKSTQQPDRLCFAIFASDGFVTPQPPIQRGLRMVTDAITRAGHEAIAWDPPSHVEAWEIHNSFMVADGGANVWEQLDLSGEPVIPEMADMFGTGPTEPAPLSKYQHNALWLKDYRAHYLEYWNRTVHKTKSGRAVDAVILPVAPHAAVIPGKYYHYGYSDFVDLLNFTSVCIPVTHADKNLDKKDATYTPVGATDYQNWKAYDPEVYHGAPVGIQIMGRKFEEEKMMSIAYVVAEALEAAKLRG